MNTGIQELWEDVGNKSCATLLWSHFLFLSFSLYLLAILLLRRGNLECTINQVVSWPHTAQPKQASGFRMQMSRQTWAWSILCRQFISFSLPLSRNRSNVKKMNSSYTCEDIPRCCSDSAPGIPDQAWRIFLSTYVPPSVLPIKEMTIPQPQIHPLAMLTKARGTFQTDTNQTEKEEIMHSLPMTDLNRF